MVFVHFSPNRPINHAIAPLEPLVSLDIALRAPVAARMTHRVPARVGGGCFAPGHPHREAQAAVVADHWELYSNPVVARQLTEVHARLRALLEGSSS